MTDTRTIDMNTRSGWKRIWKTGGPRWFLNINIMPWSFAFGVEIFPPKNDLGRGFGIYVWPLSILVGWIND